MKKIYNVVIVNMKHINSDGLFQKTVQKLHNIFHHVFVDNAQCLINGAKDSKEFEKILNTLRIISFHKTTWLACHPLQLVYIDAFQDLLSSKFVSDVLTR